MLKNLGLIFAFFVLLFLFAKFGPSIPFSINSISTAQPAPFTVSAEGKVVAKPDTAQVSLGVQTTGNSVKGAQDQANKVINDVTAAIKQLGLADKDIKTTNYSVYPDEQLSVDEVPVTLQAPTAQKIVQPFVPLPAPPLRKITKYHVNVNLLVTAHDFDKLNQVIDAATTNGANQIGGINFTVDKIEDFQSQARKIAIDNAKVKAAEIAKEAGITLVRIINVSEGYSNNYPRPMMAATAEKATTPTQVEPGSSEITVSVTLSYETR